MSGNGAQRTWRGGIGATSTRMTGGGYLEHRRLLQASRNGGGYDRP